jgi:hypothetical protein
MAVLTPRSLAIAGVAMAAASTAALVKLAKVAEVNFNMARSFRRMSGSDVINKSLGCDETMNRARLKLHW